MFKILLYKENFKEEWDKFVEKSKNSHFFFKRDFMEYHRDRFEDYSLMIFEGNKLISILPCNVNNREIYSHQGLTYGGFLIDNSMKLPKFLKLFEEVLNFLRKEGFKRLIYKVIPYIYHKIPAEEDRYALFIHNAKLIRRDTNTVIYLGNYIASNYQERKKRYIKKAQKSGIVVKESNNFKKYWDLLSNVLWNRYKVKPVHSLEEILYLKRKFPNNIRLFVAEQRGKLLAGTVVFENKFTVHTQYLANSEEGRKIGALDFIIHKLLTEIYSHKKYFSFGISNEKEGRFLNEGLISWKEGFGARVVVHDIYEVEI